MNNLPFLLALVAQKKNVMTLKLIGIIQMDLHTSKWVNVELKVPYSSDRYFPSRGPVVPPRTINYPETSIDLLKIIY